MALQMLYLSALFSFFLFMLAILKIRKKPSKTDSNSNLPPGPRKLPIIGNLHHLTGSLPHRKLRDLAKKYGPLMHLQLGEVSAIVVSSPAYAREVLKTHDLLFASRPEILASKIIAYDSTNIAFAPCSDYWRQLRKICTMELLSIKRVQSFRPIREEEITSFIRWIASKEGSPIDLTGAVNSLIYTITSKTAFGKKFKDQDQFISVVTQALGFAAGFDIVDLFPSSKWPQIFSRLRSRIEGLHEQADRIVGYIINEHKEARSRDKEGQSETEEDLIDVLLKYEDDDDEELEFRITVNNIKAIILDIFGAGGDTAATTIDWAMAEMIKNPRVMKQAQAEVREVFHRIGRVDETSINELKYLKAVVKETLRLHPPGPLLLPRESRQACEINGYHIPLKTKVIINAWAIARDSNHWDEPDRFYPERFINSPIDYKGTNFEYIPFGAGRRICPGMAFGLANLELVLASLLYHFDWELPGGFKGKDLSMEEVFGLTVRRKSNLCLIPINNSALPVTRASHAESRNFDHAECYY